MKQFLSIFYLNIHAKCKALSVRELFLGRMCKEVF